jgi:phenylalanyl-tRNA synthetase beta chain
VRVPLSWLRELAPVPGTPADVADACNRIGLVVEAVEEPGREIRGVRVARILDVVPHPDADKLRLADVDFGDGTTRVVCGAPNIEPGQLVPFAPAGAELPGGFKLERRKIRGVVSDGMLCSARELGLGDDHAGILVLDADAPLGADVREVLGLDDAVLDLEITANRPDAMSIAGVARDLAAATGVPFTLPEPVVTAGARRVPDLATVVVEAPDRCPRYLAWTATVAMGPSPAWMARRLVQAGMRPISNVVDVTNYVMLERGQPLHAFDRHLLAGGGIVVRVAADGERMTTLDGIERTFTPADLLICDGERVPQAIAGIMGGATSEVSDTTTEILLESAYFEPAGILRSSKRLGLRSDASARFERGIDPAGAHAAAARAMELLAQVAGSQADADPVDVYPAPVARARVTVRTSRVNAVLGTQLDRPTVHALLEPLGFEVDAQPDGDALAVTVPTFRPDVTREIDVVEEVARHHGYANIPTTVPRNGEVAGGLTPHQRARRAVKEALRGWGASEGMTFSLVAASDLERAGFPGTGIELENPLRAEESLLRTAILPGLLRAAAFNAAHGIPDVALFELGHVFLPPPPGQVLPDERDHVAGVLTGREPRRPHEPDRPVDVHDAVGLVHVVRDALELVDLRIEQAADAPGLHPARAAAVLVDGAPVGWVGEVHPDVVVALDLPTPVVAFELRLDALLDARRRDRRYVAPSRYPATNFDLAFVVPEAVAADAVRRTLVAAGGPLLETVRLFDVFRSEALGEGRRSLTSSLRFRAPDRTLTDEETATLRQACIDAVVAAHGAELRGA